MPVLEDFMTSQEAGNRLNLTPRQITGACKKGDLFGAIKHGGIWLIPKSSVDVYEKTIKRNTYHRKEAEIS